MKKLLAFFGLFVLLAIGGFAVQQHRSSAYAADCDANAIIMCGVKDQAELQSDYKANATKDLPAIYSHYKISADMISNSKAKLGTVYKNGDVKIGSELVATGAESVGRHNMAGSTPVKIGNETIYQRKTSVSFAADSIPALIFVDANGKFIAAVLKSCGNPVVATPKPKPVYACKSLKATQGNKRDEFEFAADASYNDVTFKNITYTVKDKSGKVVGQPIVAADAKPVKYTQAKAGTYSVEAVLTVVAAGKQVSTKVGDCKASFTVKAAPQAVCTSLAVTPVAGKRDQFTFKPVFSMSSGVTLKSAVFTVKDDKGATVDTVTRANADQFVYTRGEAGVYTVATTSTFTGPEGTITDNGASCKANFSVKAAPVFVCSGLTAAQSGDRTQFTFTPLVDVTGGAVVKSVVYTVKDANGVVVDTLTQNDTKSAKYTQVKEGDYTVTAVVTVTVDGQDKVATGDCAASFTVKPAPPTPKFECSKFTVAPVAGQKNTYNFTVFYVAEGGAQLSKAMVNFGDSTTAEEVPAANLANFQHVYAKAGSYTATTTLSFITGASQTAVQDVTCTVKVEVTPELCTVPGKEDQPADSTNCFTPCKFDSTVADTNPNCKPCEFNAAIGAKDAACKKPEQPQVLPATLVNTGPGDIAGMFAAISFAATIAHRFVWMRFGGRL